ncbi:MAG TPA: hypothetical protein VL261_10385 [Nitrospira sp.]|jgi:hypothetical protein|nr:hypothetical protein [Nitrospira sp.]
MPTNEQTRSAAEQLIPWTPFAVAMVLVVSMMAVREEWLYVAGVIGLLASLAVGRTSGSPRREFRLRIWKFAKSWLVVVLLAALSVLHGTWQPMVFFAVVGIVSTAFFWLGCKSSRRLASTFPRGPDKTHGTI